MATYVAHQTNVISNSSSVAGTIPAATMGQEMLLAHFYMRTASSVSTVPSGWTIVPNLQMSQVSPGQARAHAVYYKIAAGAYNATSSEAGTSPTWTVNAAGDGLITIFRITEHASTFTASNKQTYSTGTEPHIAPSISCGATDLLLVLEGNNQDGTHTFPVGMNELSDQSTGGATTGIALASAQEQMSSAGTTGTRSIAISTGTCQGDAIAITIPDGDPTWTVSTTPFAIVSTHNLSGVVSDVQNTDGNWLVVG